MSNQTITEKPEDLWIPWNKADDDKDTSTILIEEYRDAGNWARHYSTVRMTLATFFLTVGVGIITARWDKPQWATALVALSIVCLGVCLYVAFSYLTFQEMNKQLAIVDGYRRKLTDLRDKMEKRHSKLFHLTSLPLALIALVLFGGLALGWALSGPSNQTAPVQAGLGKIPIQVQVGQSAPVTLDVPVTITVPGTPKP